MIFKIKNVFKKTKINPQQVLKPTKPKKIPITEAKADLNLEWNNNMLERIGLRYGFEYALLRSAREGIETLNAAECGVYRGYGLLMCAELAKQYGLDVNFYGFDSFEGFPPLSDVDRQAAPPEAPYLNKTLFQDTSFEEVNNLFKLNEIKNVNLRKGFFSDTLPREENREYFFVHIDCDLYAPHLECLEYFYKRTIKGGVILFDDYHSVIFPMAKKAVDNFLKDKKEKLIHVRGDSLKDNFTKCFIVKA